MVSEDHTPARRRKRRLLLAAALFLCLIVVIEAILQLSGYGYSVDVTLKKMVGGKERYVHNPQLGRRYFDTFHPPELTPFSFDVDKDARTYRIFVLGDATAQGYPSENYDIGRMLERVLKNEYAGTDFEVINLGLPGADSRTIRSLAVASLEYEPDMLIVMAGNDDSILPVEHKRLKTPMAVAMAATKIGQSWQTFRASGDTAEALPVISGYEETPDDIGKQVRALCKEGTSAGAAVMLCTMPINAQALGVSAENQRARLNDQNVVLTALASEMALDGVSLVDLVSIVGLQPEALHEGTHHLSFEGRAAVAQAIADSAAMRLSRTVVEHASGKPALSRQALEERLVYSDLERYFEKRRILTTERTELSQESQALLHDQAEKCKADMQPKMSQLMGRYKQQTTEHPDDWRLNWKAADYAYRFYKNYPLAKDQAEKVLQSVSHTGARLLLLRMTVSAGHLEEGEMHARALIENYPAQGQYYFDLGEIYKIRGEYEEAIQWFNKGIALKPGPQSIMAYTYLAELYEAIGQPRKAIDILTASLEDDPSEHSGRAYANLALLLAAEDRQPEAVGVIKRSLEHVSPDAMYRQDELHRFLESVGEHELAARFASATVSETESP